MWWPGSLLSSLSEALWGSFQVPVPRLVMLPAPHLCDFTTWTLCVHSPCSGPLALPAGGGPHGPRCATLSCWGRVSYFCFLAASYTLFVPQRRMDFWFQGVVQPGTSIRPCCRPLSFSPLLIFSLCCGGETAIVKGPLVKIKITLLYSAAALGLWQPWDVPGGSSDGHRPGWRGSCPAWLQIPDSY